MRQQSPKRFNPLIAAVLVVLWLLTIFFWLFFVLAGEPPAPLAAPLPD